MKFLNKKNSIIGLAITLSLSGAVLTGCGSSASDQGQVVMEKTVPTEGLITTVKEVTTNSFKIEDEQTVKDTADSRIIAKYLDNTVDTFTLAQARLIQRSEPNSRAGSVVQSAGMGYFGFMMLGSMMGPRPSVGAYTNSGVHSRVNNAAGSSMQRSARTVRSTRPSSGRSGYGSGKSTRSYGG